MLPPSWRGDLGVDPSGRPPRSATPTLMAAVPPAQGGIQMLGVAAPCLPLPLIEHGIITNWNDMEKIWHRTFYNKLMVAPEDHPFLLAEVNTKTNRELMTQIMFETFDVPAMHMVTQAVLFLFASGRTTDSVMDSGGGVSHTVPIHEGFALHHAILLSAGRDPAEYLMKYLIEQGYFFTAAADRVIARDVKEKLCYIGVNYDTKLKSTAETDKEKTYELPDGNFIAVGAKRFHCVKVLFQPSFTSEEVSGFHDCLSSACPQTDTDQLYITQ